MMLEANDTESLLLYHPRGVDIPRMSKSNKTTHANDFAAVAAKLAEEGPRHFVRHWRKLRGMTQTDLANQAGTIQQHITKIERGERDLMPAMAQRIAAALDVSLPQLLFGPDAPTEKEMHMVRAVRAMAPGDAKMIQDMIDRLHSTTKRPIPQSLAAMAEEEGINLEDFDPNLWAELEAYAAKELQSYPQLGGIERARAYGLVEALYLYALPNHEAGKNPDYSQLRHFIRMQAAGLRGRNRRPN